MKANWISIVGSLSLGALALTGCKKAEKEEAPAKTAESAEHHCGADATHKTGEKACGAHEHGDGDGEHKH